MFPSKELKSGLLDFVSFCCFIRQNPSSLSNCDKEDEGEEVAENGRLTWRHVSSRISLINSSQLKLTNKHPTFTLKVNWT